VTPTPLEILDRRKWLLRLVYIRLVAFSIFILIPWITGRFDNPDDMAVLLGAVFVLTAGWSLLLRVNTRYVAQAYAQIILDLLLITWTVNRTGGVDSYVSNLYFLEIVMASILLARRGAFLAGTLSSILHFAHLDLVKLGFIEATGSGGPEWPDLQLIIAINIFGFTAVAYLSHYLAESLRHAGVLLERSTGQMAYLQAFNNRIVDSMGSGLITTDSAGRIYLFNRAAEHITGWRTAEARRMTLKELFPEVQAVDATRFETSTRRNDGREIYLRFSVSPVTIDERETAGYVWCVDDLTELRQLERQMRQKEQMATIGAMSAGIAHEIRNPLASITGSFKLLQSGLELNQEQGRLAEIVTREAERLNRTITEFLSYARPPAPKLHDKDLDVLIGETVSLLRNSPELKPTHSIETKLESVRRPVDESMMRQVFYNLASNAFRAMPDGGKLTITLKARNGNARIQFEDTGRGMDEEEMRRLFVPFQSSFTKGTGLGLPTVYRIVNAHNGTITVQSRRGAGSVFAIDI
jgi:two-component system sensor histidine kinase PilS (NtrC family)